MRTVVITGATSGIGFQAALRFAERGDRVIGIGRRPEGFRALRDQITDPDRHVYLVADLSEIDRLPALVDRIRAHAPVIDVLVNNAGIGCFAPLTATDPTRCRAVFDVNVFAPIELTRLLLPHLRRDGSAVVVNVASVAGKRTWKHLTAYSASKFALIGFSNSLRRELRYYRIPIRVTVVCPSATRTNLFASAGYPEYERDHTSSTLINPCVVAAAIVDAVQFGRREVIVSARARALDLLARCAPSFVEWLEDAVAQRH